MKCNLCERKCNIDRTTKLGACQANNKMKIARVSLHEWEEPSISGTNGSGTIFFSYCNLKCIYCQNYELSQNHLGYYATTNDFSNMCLYLQKKKAHNINLVTPTHYVPNIIEGLKLAKTKGLNIPIVYNTSSYETIETIKSLNGYIDIYLPDLKYYDNKYGINYSNVINYFEIATKAIDEMYKQVGPCKFDENGILQKGMIVRHLCLPGLKEDSKKIIKYLYNKYHDNIFISIMNQYTPVRHFDNYTNLNRKVTDEEYDEIIDYAIDLGVTNAYIQEGETQKTSFIPNFNENPLEKISSL